MAGHFTISLRNLRFFAEHGMYQEERLVGNDFEVDIELGCKAPKKGGVSMDETINYVEVYRITQEIFAVHSFLLETCAMKIADALEEQFPQIEDLSISIRKLNPPITNFTGSVSVSYRKKVK